MSSNGRTTALLAAMLCAVRPAAAQDRKIEDAVAKAERAVDDGKPLDALAQAGKLARTGTAESLLAAARIQAYAGKLEEAAAAAQQALDASPAPDLRVRVLSQMAGLDIQRGTARDAVAHALEAAEGNKTAETLALLARAQAHAKDPQAVATAEKAIALAPDSAVVQDALGQALTAAGKYAEADAALSKALSLDPKLYDAHVHRTFLLLSQGKAAEAEAAARQAVAVGPQHGIGFALLGAALLAEDPKDPKAIEAAIAQAAQARFLSEHNAYVQLTVGNIFEKMGDLTQARTAYEKAAGIDPGYTPARVALVKAEYFAGNIDGALARARELADDNPGDGEAQLLYGRILLRKGDYAGALSPLERAAELLPTSHDVAALLGAAYQLNRQYGDAADSFGRAVTLAPDNVAYRLEYAGALSQAKRFDLAIAQYQDVQTREPSSAPAALGLGRAQYFAEKYTDAVASFAQAAALDPKIASEAHFMRAVSSLALAQDTKNKALLAQVEAAVKDAAAAGLPPADPRLARLQASLDRFRKGDVAQRPADEPREKPSGPDFPTVVAALKDANPGVRGRAARQCAQFGADCVPYLRPMVNNDPELAVRADVARALGAVGSAAAPACGELAKEMTESAERMVLPRDQTKRSAEEEAKRFGREQVVQSACREARAKIGCK
jgi:tetratricopeptide (TPR) repeat protein